MNLLKPIGFFLKLAVFLLGMSSFSLWAEETTHATEENNHQETMEKGPHGGRLFKDGDLALEFLIFERGMPPHFRAYLYKNGEMILPQKAELIINLTRFGGKKEQITFIPVENFLQSNQIIEEPHSFDVTIQLNSFGKPLSW
ncbi:TPA: cation transporter, partial [Legionella pneumophila]|nr:cation transporter [Legionella pneumophila]